MSKILDIIVPKETVSDDTYKVTSLEVSNGTWVKKGQIIGSFETSKADVDIEAPIDGYVFFNCSLNSVIRVGSLFACISDTSSIPDTYLDKHKIIPENDVQPISNKIIDSSIRISKSAAKLIEAHSIDIKVFAGQSIIGREDVEGYLNNKEKRAVKNFVADPKRESKVVIIGGGNHTKVCIDIIRQMQTLEIAGIVYTRSRPVYPLMDCEILGSLGDLENIYKNVALNAVIGIGGLENPGERAELYRKLKEIGFLLPNIVHPKSIIEPSVSLGEGNQILGGANIGSCSLVGNNCIINSNSIVSHDCVIGDNVHITPGAILAGTVKVGANSIIGMGVTIFYNCSIGNNVVINNGINVYKDVPDGSVIK
jgi:sugar O-acyltransferase (sialic acid O-acetyltransferase NeuD family)